MSENGKQADWIKSIHLKYFTAFEDLHIPEFSPGINFIIGENGTGKTHLLKVMYALCQWSRKENHDTRNDIFAYFVEHYFSTKSQERWNLINTSLSNAGNLGFKEAEINFVTSRGRFGCELHDNTMKREGQHQSLGLSYGGSEKTINIPPIKSIFVPAKEMLSHNKGFTADYDERNIPFERHYRDILSKAAVTGLRKGEQDEWICTLLSSVEQHIEGPVIELNGQFYINRKDGLLEFTLVAEGHRKLALYWLLLNNGMLDEGTILFIDEPEANLNPKLMSFMVDLLLALSRNGIQIFVASHSYVMLKALEQKSSESDRVMYHVLYRDDNETRSIRCQSVDDPVDLDHDPILEAYNELYDRDIELMSKELS